ncbi:MAG TPA: glycine cleavage T C-terminal barrel domain-containing protein, partial [Clostridia bacterium]|nr:glycine cleavage T C-terminal barrel domain-containing protein [Clostridia bacterium]
PTLGGNYAMALVDISAKDAKEFEVSVRGRKLKAEAAALPFYKRA